MNATSLSELRAGGIVRPKTDEKMEQVRELLFGEAQRRYDLQIAALEDRVRELESTMARRLADLEARLETLSSRTADDRRGAFEELGRSVGDLGQRIKELALK